MKITELSITPSIITFEVHYISHKESILVKYTAVSFCSNECEIYRQEYPFKNSITNNFKIESWRKSDFDEVNK